MLPVFFPSTYITESTLKVSLAWFDTVVVYQPSDLDIPIHYHPFQKAQQLIIRMPLTDHFDLNRLKQERLHLKAMGKELGPNMAHIKGMPETPPFVNDLSITRIRSQIKNNDQHKEKAELKPLLTALFLHLVQDFDIQNNDLHKQLANVEASEKQLFNMLKDSDGDDYFMLSPNVKKNWGQEQIFNLLKNWFFVNQQDHDQTGVLITDNRDVISEIEEWNSDLQLTLALHPSEQSQKSMIWQKILDYVYDKAPFQTHDLQLTSKTSHQLYVYTLKGPLTGPFIPVNNDSSKQPSIKNTCIVFVSLVD
ncbi:MAG: hypothetical protein HQK75_15020 [Candidatus Magnetomorum sp.]|nr:hypothetical protein [Candidatus Magnetomorum sp.]